MKPFTEYSPDIAASFIMENEGFRAKAYTCTSGVWTIGYGHTGGVKQGDEITKERAVQLLLQDMKSTINGLARYIKVDVTAGQFVALLDFAFNVGVKAAGESKLMTFLNEGKAELASTQFARWKYSNGKVVDGLIKRREREKALFNQPELKDEDLE